MLCLFFFQAEDGIRDYKVTGVQTCALPICEEKVYCGKEYVWDRRPSNVPSDREQFRVVRDVRRKRGIQRAGIRTGLAGKSHRSEERRVGREWSYRWWR